MTVICGHVSRRVGSVHLTLNSISWLIFGGGIASRGRLYHGHMAAGGQVKVRGGYWEDLRNPSEAVALIQYASDTACRDAIRTNIRDLDGESRHLLLSKHERGRRFETKELHWW